MISVSAPGSLMLMGEHAVLQGYPAIVAAIDQRLQVHLTPRSDDQIYAKSNLGTYQGCLSDLPTDHTWRFVIATIQHFLSQLTHGIGITIESEINSTIGFGSSAALVVALTKALAIATDTPLDNIALTTLARQLIRDVQGRGSGSDVAASVFGGVVYYHPDTDTVTPIDYLPNIVAVYSGYKTPTPEVIATVMQRVTDDPAHYQRVFADIGTATEQGKQALLNRDLTAFADALQTNQNLMTELGVCDDTLQAIIDTLQQHPAILAAKISGSGLGDCVIGLCREKPSRLSAPVGYVQSVNLGKCGVSITEN